MTRPCRNGEGGVVLINVLVILSIASTVVFLMLSSQEISLERARVQASGAAADALARGAESSAITALRRDMQTAPKTDNYAEPWAQVTQAQANLATGTFSVSIRDAQARLNLSRLRTGAVGEIEVMLRVLVELDISRSEGVRLATEIAARPGLSSLADLRSVSPATLNLIAPYVDFLPNDATVNLNTADPLLLRALLNNRSAALRLERRRSTNGFLTPDDLAAVGAARPASAGFTSQNFEVTSQAEVDGVSLTLTSIIQRQDTFAGQSVVATRRIYGVPLNTVPDLPMRY